jgi:threonyl-tRNA synthetase
LAEKYLADALNSFGKPWTINKGDGAFYGPKIDVKLFDSLKREHQCGTIQVDFVLPQRFDLQFRSAEGEEELKKKKEAIQKDQVCAEEDHKCDKNAKKDKKTIKDQKEDAAGEKKIQVGHGEIDHSYKKSQADLEKPTKPGFERPVIVHRAILGSVERMMAILCEHYAGKFPFWLSPRQVIVLPLSEKILDYAEKVHKRLVLVNI